MVFKKKQSKWWSPRREPRPLLSFLKKVSWLLLILGLAWEDIYVNTSAHFCLYDKQCEENRLLLVNPATVMKHRFVYGSCDPALCQMTWYGIDITINNGSRDMQDLIVFMFEFFCIHVKLYLPGFSIKCYWVQKYPHSTKFSSMAYSSISLCHMLYLFE